MEVKLISSSMSDVKLLEMTAKFKEHSNNKTVLDIYKEISIEDEKNRSSVESLAKYGDISTLEHMNLCFAISGLTLRAEAFLTSYRLSLITFKNEKDDKYNIDKVYVPKFRFNSYVNDDVVELVNKEYIDFCNQSFGAYEYLISKGIDKRYASNVLPSFTKTDVIFSTNIKELIHIINSATNGRGKDSIELNELGQKMTDELKNILPGIFENIQELDDVETKKLQKLNELFEKENIYCDVDDRSTLKQVELISYTEDAEELIGMTTLINHTNCSTDYAKVRTNDTEFLKKILEIICTERRARELEMVRYTFRINNVTMPLLKEVMSSKVSSIAVPSFAQIGKSKLHFIPQCISECKDEEVIAKYNEIFDKSIEIFEKLKEYDVIKEDLLCTNLEGDYVVDTILTMNARELYKFFKYKTSLDANKEIREVACTMLNLVKEVSPFIFFNAGTNDTKEKNVLVDDIESKEEQETDIIE